MVCVCHLIGVLPQGIVSVDLGDIVLDCVLMCTYGYMYVRVHV